MRRALGVAVSKDRFTAADNDFSYTLAQMEATGILAIHDIGDGDSFLDTPPRRVIVFAQISYS
jgi:hypothetical protein